MARRGIPVLHVVTDDAVLARPAFVREARPLLEFPGVALHLRGPRTEARRLWQLGRELGSGLMVVNDRVDLAMALEAELGTPVGSQLPRRGLPAAEVRRLRGDAAWIGQSGSVADLASPAPGADFRLAGTLYPTASHPGRGGAGAQGLATALAASTVPGTVVAIGGITPERIPELTRAGAAGVAVLRGIWDARDTPAEAAGRYLNAWREAVKTESGETLGLMVNGDPRTVPTGTTVAGLLRELELAPALVVVERNREIVPREKVADVLLEEGDSLELVHFVGGG